MKVIPVAQKKGGTGKTLLSTNLAGMLAADHKTLLVDANLPQQSATDWYAMRSVLDRPENLKIARVDSPTKMKKVLEQASVAFDYMVIDTAPEFDGILDVVLDDADLILMPTRPNLAELKANSSLIDEIERSGVPFYIVWNQFRGTARHKEYIAAVKEEGKISAMKTHLTMRTAYEEAQDEGMLATETDDHAAYFEMTSLKAHVLRILEGE